MASIEPFVSVNVVSIDYVMAYSRKSNSYLKMEGDEMRPVVRVFGSTPHGQRACVHIHGFLPSFYFRPRLIKEQQQYFKTQEQVETYLDRMREKIEKFLNDEERRKRYADNTKEQKEYRNKKFIAAIETYTSRTIYGYHNEEYVFVKLTVYNPASIRSICTLLETGGLAIGVVMQPYESHITYVNKFLVDYNIKPMGWLHLGDGRFRFPLPSNESPFPPPQPFASGESSQQSRVVGSIPANSHDENSSSTSVHYFRFSQNIISSNFQDKCWQRDEQPGEGVVADEIRSNKDTICDLEIDSHIDNILNINMKKAKFGEELWDEARVRHQRKFNEDMPEPPLIRYTDTDHRPATTRDDNYKKRIEQLELLALREDEVVPGDGASSESPDKNAVDSAAAASQGSEYFTQLLEEDEFPLHQSASIQGGMTMSQDMRYSGHEADDMDDEGYCTDDSKDIDDILQCSQPNNEEESAPISDEKSRSQSQKPPKRLRRMQQFDVFDMFGDSAPNRPALGSGEKQSLSMKKPSISSEMTMLSSSSAATAPIHDLSRSLLLKPTFYCPNYSNLTPIIENGVNKKLFYGNPEDEEPRLTNSRKHAQFHPDCSLAQILGQLELWEYHTSDKQQSGTISYNHAKCLIPSFSPPLPMHLHRNAYKEPIQRIRTNPSVSHTQISSPTPTGGSANEKHQLGLNIGEVTIRENLICRLTTMSIEIFATSTQGKAPDPKRDPLVVICYSVDDSMTSSETETVQNCYGVILYDELQQTNVKTLIKNNKLEPNSIVTVVASEVELVEKFFYYLEQIDPDIVVSYEVQHQSLGYIIQRAAVVLNVPPDTIRQRMSRILNTRTTVPTQTKVNDDDDSNDAKQYYAEHSHDIFLPGRVVINIWRYVARELKLYSNTLMNVAEQLLRKKIPHYTALQLSDWFRQPACKGRTISYIQLLSILNLSIMEKLDVVRLGCESARLYGIDFHSVLTRGSQFRVEAAILRCSKQEKYLLISPNKQQVANQAAMKCIPLVCEPHSQQFYHHPVVVLDFQSLYPSLVIAHNLCFSTILGQLNMGIHGSHTTGTLGVVEYSEEYTVNGLSNHSYPNAPYIAPSGAVFANKNVRLGVLPQVLKEVLDTRIMVKRELKKYTGDEYALLRKSLDARQLAIKLLANVTYGYTAAGFSGRMPCAELADAIVESGKTLLQETMRYIREHKVWKANVVYGDTDSIFVELPYRSLAEAVAVGNQIAEEITSRNKQEIVLKYEKTYYGCLLISKKRYVGYSFEKASDVGSLDAKGIEVIRRDQCLATAKIQEKCLRILFQERDISLMRQYLQQQWRHILQGGSKVSIKDFIFWKQVKVGKYKADGPPAHIIYQKKLQQDSNAVIPYGWKVPYVVVTGQGNLSQLVCTPEDLAIRGTMLRVNSKYYIEKHINAALKRCFSLCDIDIELWYKQLTKPRECIRPNLAYEYYTSTLQKRNLITSYLPSDNCQLCGLPVSVKQSEKHVRERYDQARKIGVSLCATCAAPPLSQTLLMLYPEVNQLQARGRHLTEVCNGKLIHQVYAYYFTYILFLKKLVPRSHSHHNTTRRPLFPRMLATLLIAPYSMKGYDSSPR
jgi:DNA polymerase elongation subunit (family B)